MMKLIVGLGNIGEEYKKTRHNFGFMAVDQLAKEFEFPKFNLEKKFFGQISVGQIGIEKAILLKPETYMNLSGKAVSAIAHFYKIPANDVFIFFDDVDTEFGNVKFKEKGGSGGHNGLKSIMGSLGSDEFRRIKFGIGNKDLGKIPTESFVLQNFSKDELGKIPKLLDKGIEKFLENINH